MPQSIIWVIISLPTRRLFYSSCSRILIFYMELELSNWWTLDFSKRAFFWFAQFIWMDSSFAWFFAISFDDRFLCGDVVSGLRLFDRFLIPPVLPDLPLPLSSLASGAVAPVNLILPEETDSFNSRGTFAWIIISYWMGCSVCKIFMLTEW